MTAFTAFYPGVLPYAQNCPNVVALDAVRNAAIEFCNETLCWQADSDPQTTVIGTAGYDIDIPGGAQVRKVVSVLADSVNLSPTTVGTLNCYRPAWRTDTGNAQAFVQDSATSVLLYPIPSVAQNLIIRAAYTPTRAATAVDDLVYQRWFDAVCEGAKARLFSIAGEPFYDATKAMASRRLFRAYLIEARIDVNKQWGLAETRVVPVPFI